MNETDFSKASRTALTRRSGRTGNRHLQPTVSRDEAFYERTATVPLARAGIVPGRGRLDSLCLAPTGADPSPRPIAVGQSDLAQTPIRRKPEQQGVLELRRTA